MMRLRKVGYLNDAMNGATNFAVWNGVFLLKKKMMHVDVPCAFVRKKKKMMIVDVLCVFVKKKMMIVDVSCAFVIDDAEQRILIQCQSDVDVFDVDGAIDVVTL